MLGRPYTERFAHDAAGFTDKGHPTAGKRMGGVFHGKEDFAIHAGFQARSLHPQR